MNFEISYKLSIIMSIIYFISRPRVERVKPKLYSKEIVIIGHSHKSKDNLTQEIIKHGGSVKTKIHSGVFAVISNKEEIEKMNKRMQEVKECKIHVVTENFLEKLHEANDVIALMNESAISDWHIDVLI